MAQELEHETFYEAFIQDRLVQLNDAGPKLAQVQAMRKDFGGSFTFEEALDGKKEVITMDAQYEKMVRGAISGAFNELMDEGVHPIGYYDDDMFGKSL